MNCENGSNSCVSYFIQGITDGFKTKTTSFSGCYFGYNGANNCLSECLIDGMPEYFYAKNMGGPYNYILPFWGLGFGTEYYPVYHKRGNIEEGTPIDFLGILLGAENIKVDASTSVYPNPASDAITVSNNTVIKEIEIYNSVGLLVLKTQLQQINISNLAAGFYYIKIIKNDNTFVEKRFVKQ
jgi:Secretion system C-terminal sorting domain